MVIVRKYLRPLLIDYNLFSVREYEKWRLINYTFKVSYKSNSQNLKKEIKIDEVQINNILYNPYSGSKYFTSFKSYHLFDKVINESANKKQIFLKGYSLGYVQDKYYSSNLVNFHIPVESKKSNVNNVNLKNKKISEYKLSIFDASKKSIILDYKRVNFYVDTPKKDSSQKIVNFTNITKYKIQVIKDIKRINVIEDTKINYHLISVYEYTELKNCPTCKKLGSYSFVVNKEYSTEENYISPQSLQDTYLNPTIEVNVPVGFDVVIFRIPSEDIYITKLLEYPKENVFLSLIDNKTLIGKFVIPNETYKIKLEINTGQTFDIIVKTLNTTPYS